MVELAILFESYPAFLDSMRTEGYLIRSKIKSIPNDVIQNGVIEPLTGRRHAGQDIKIDLDRPQVSIFAGNFNSRSRADMLAIEHGLGMLPPQRRQRPRLLGAEGITPLSMILRTLTPYYLPTEYLPTEQDKQRHFPIRHLDMMNVDFEPSSFDMFFSAHVFEHVPDITQAIHQVSNVIAPGGVLVSTFPFDPDREFTLTKARLDSSGVIEYITEPEYHKNPVHQQEGSLVFQLPGWDILDTCRAAGFKEAAFVMLASSSHGVIGRKGIGIFALLARKPQNGEDPVRRTIKQKRVW
jgi:SAM-dependent methyltransferase